MPTVLVEKDRCKGCGLCVSACPSHVLAMTQEINAKGYFYPMVEHPDDCNGCLHCALVCPDVAVQVEVKGKATERPEALNDLPMHYCPGCTHGVIHRLVAEAFGGPDGTADRLPILVMERHIVAPFAPRLRGVRRSSTVV